MAQSIRVGAKVQYKHGRGFATGKLVANKNGVATIETKNGSRVNRNASYIFASGRTRVTTTCGEDE